MNAGQEPTATEIGSSARDRWRSALGWGVFVLVGVVLMSRVVEHHRTILVLGVVLAAVIFVVALRTRPAVVTDDEIRLPRRSIPRAGVARVTSSSDTTALVFRDDQGAIVGLADLHERSGELREALRTHGWPEVRPES